MGLQNAEYTAERTKLIYPMLIVISILLTF